MEVKNKFKRVPLSMAFNRKLFPWYVSPGSGKLVGEQWKLTKEEAWLLLVLGAITNYEHKFRFSVDELYNYITGRDPLKVPLAEVRHMFDLMESAVDKCNHIAEYNGGTSFDIDWGKNNGKLQRHSMVRGKVFTATVRGRGGFVYFSILEIITLLGTFENAKYKLVKAAWMMFYLKSQFLRLGDPSKEYYVVGYAGGNTALADSIGVSEQTCKNYLKTLLSAGLITLALVDDREANVYIVGLSPDTEKIVKDTKQYGIISYRAKVIGGRPTTKKEGEQDTFVI